MVEPKIRSNGNSLYKLITELGEHDVKTGF